MVEPVFREGRRDYVRTNHVLWKYHLYAYELDFLLPLELSPSGYHHFYEGAQGVAQWVLSATAEYSVSTQGLLRARSVISHMHPELLTPLYSVQVVWFSAFFTILKYPRLILKPILNDTSQDLMGFKSYWVVKSLMLLLRISSASKTSSAGTLTCLQAVGGPVRMGSSQWEVRVTSEPLSLSLVLSNQNSSRLKVYSSMLEKESMSLTYAIFVMTMASHIIQEWRRPSYNARFLFK